MTHALEPKRKGHVLINSCNPMEKKPLYRIKIAGEEEFEVFNDAKWVTKRLIDMDATHLQNTANMILQGKYNQYNINSTELINGYTGKQWVMILITQLRHLVNNNDKLIVLFASTPRYISAVITYRFKDKNKKDDIQRNSSTRSDETARAGISLQGRSYKIAASILHFGNPYKVAKCRAKIESSKI